MTFIEAQLAGQLRVLEDSVSERERVFLACFSHSHVGHHHRRPSEAAQFFLSRTDVKVYRGALERVAKRYSIELGAGPAGVENDQLVRFKGRSDVLQLCVLEEDALRKRNYDVSRNFVKE